jgi:mono/diheme cytochrome c family protein
MMKPVSVVCAAVALTASLVMAQTPAPQSAPASTTPEAAAVERGQKAFTSYGCYQCHGREAQGSSATGPRLGPRGLPLAAFMRYVRQPANQMPPYTTKVLPDADLTDIYAFVQSRPAAKPAAEIPLLK